MILAPHVFGIVGLGLNIVATVLLIWFPPTVAEYTVEGQWVPGGGTFSELPKNRYETQENVRSYRRHKRLFRLAIVLLLIGFALQLVDLLLA